MLIASVRISLKQQRNKMKGNQLALLSVLASSQFSVSTAWCNTFAASTTVQKQQAQRRFPRAFTATGLAASLAPDDAKSIAEAAFAKQDEGKEVAEGTVVSFFKGGLTAIQLNDDFTAGAIGSAVTLNSPLADAKSASSSASGDDLTGRLAIFPDGSKGVVVAQRPPIAFIYSESNGRCTEGAVKVMENKAQVDVSSTMGVVNCFGMPSSLTPESSQAIFNPIPQVADIALINSPMLTGTTMVDALAPIGKGQNMLLIGSNLDEMRDMACNFIAGQSGKKASTCIYAVTKDRDQVLSKLEAMGVRDDVIIVAAREGIEESHDEVAKAAEATVIAATACAIGEAFAKEKGEDALVIVDTLDHHKALWDATTRVLVDIYGADAVVAADREGGASSEMRAFYSSLIQRAGQYNEKKGGGSLTLAMLQTIPGEEDDGEDSVFSEEDFEQTGEKLKTRIKMLVDRKIPLTAANLRKAQIPIPSVSEGKRRLVLQHVDDIISMTDGQIWLDEELSAAGRRPPMDPQRSITRVGIGADTQSRADAPALRRVVEGLRLDLAQAASMDGAEATNASTKQTRRKNAWLLAMHQEVKEGGRTLSDSCVTLLAASSGSLDATVDGGGLAGTEQGTSIINELLGHVRSRCPDAMNEIDATLDISPERRSELDEAITKFFSS